MKIRQRKPHWLSINLPDGPAYYNMMKIVKEHKLHTICSEGKCPNMGECWKAGTATFMIGGDICTRSCKFCATKTGKPFALDPKEPENVARSVKLMGLKHCVVTSVDRDDLSDGGAHHWAETIRKVKELNPNVTMEVLIPDFDGKKELIDVVVEAKPDIISHNMETVERLTKQVRSRAKYDISLSVIKTVSESGVVAKSGMMLGLGETDEEIYETMDKLIAHGCQILTLGQYLQPTAKHLEVQKYVHPDEFKKYKEVALEKGFKVVESGPLVRSSYHAENHINQHKKID